MGIQSGSSPEQLVECLVDHTVDGGVSLVLRFALDFIRYTIGLPIGLFANRLRGLADRALGG